jgi:Flp pilus assembly pilin Flp
MSGRLVSLYGRTIGAVIRGAKMLHLLRKLWLTDEGQDIAEYAVMLAVILVIVVGTVRLVGSNSNNAFSSVASSLQ